MPYTRQHGIVSEKKYVDGDEPCVTVAGREGWMLFGMGSDGGQSRRERRCYTYTKQRPSKCISADPQRWQFRKNG